MQRQKSKLALLPALLMTLMSGIILVSPLAYASNNITINIVARVAVVDDPDNVLGGAISVGDTITGSYTYDLSTPDSNPLPTAGRYEHFSAPNGITINAGGFVFQTNPNDVDFDVRISNDGPTATGPRDLYLVISDNNLPLSNGAPVEQISWQLDDNTATALSSTALPSEPPNLSDWESFFGLRLEGALGTSEERFLIRADVISAELAEDQLVGGDILAIDMTSLFVAGAFANAVWVLPVLAGIAGAVVTLVIGKKRLVK